MSRGESGQSKVGKVDGTESEGSIESGRSRRKWIFLGKSKWPSDGKWTVSPKMGGLAKSGRSNVETWMVHKTLWSIFRRNYSTLNRDKVLRRKIT